MTMDRDMVEIGRIVRLQIQRSSLKVGPPAGKRYDPSPLLAVDRIGMDENGAFIDSPDGPLLDVHHGLHSESKNRGNINPISIGFTGHYDRIRDRYGALVEDGIAGENILVDVRRPIDLNTVSSGFVIEGSDGRRIRLGSVSVAHPCVEFSRFVMGDASAPPKQVSEVLRFLDNGMRGYYAVVTDGRHKVHVGDVVYAMTPA